MLPPRDMRSWLWTFWINADQYFAPVPEAVWRYRVGGYQVCEKWLKDRQDRRLSLDEIRTYCRIVTALGRTISIQAELDGAYAGVEAGVVGFLPKRNSAQLTR